jgi:dolichol-phosphate mannosyltransferase
MLPRPAAAPLTAPAVELSIVVPSFNERDNVLPLVSKLEAALQGIGWEVIYVDDDSQDGTADRVRELARDDPRVRCLQRIGRRGLSSAVIEGILASSAPYVAVIDADMQHDETLLPQMLDRLKAGGLDVVVGSRYVSGGGIGDWSGRRVSLSQFATRLSRLAVRQPLTDPMSGFFMITRPAFDRAVRNLSAQGFKILLDLFASSPEPYRYAELPYTFRSRVHGTSKLDGLVVWEYLMLLLDKRIGRFIPARVALFLAVGGSGLLVHLAVLGSVLTWLPFAQAQFTASLVAMVTNFFINNALTYRDRRLRGTRMLRGLVTFIGICCVGAVANVAFANVLYAGGFSWWAAGIAGAVVGAVWNYTMSALLAWPQR